MNEEKPTQTDTQAPSQGKSQAKPPMISKESDVTVPSRDGGWVGAPTSQVVRTVVIGLLTTAVVLGALFLLWQVRTFVGWFVIALFLAAVLNPAVTWPQRRHGRIKRPLAIALTYRGVLLALLLWWGSSCRCWSTR